MMAAIMGVVLLIDRQTAGLLQGTVYFLFPLPMVFYGVKYGWKNSWIVYASILILAAILGTPATLALVACESFIGMLYGCGMYHHTETRKLVLRTIVASVLTEVVTTLIFGQFFGYDMASEIQEMKTMFEQMTSSANASLPDGFDVEQLIVAILVTSVVASGVLEALVLHFLSRLLFRRLRIHVEPSRPLGAYYPPKWSGYVAIAATLCFYYAFTQTIDNDVLKMAMEGIGMCGTIYLCFYGIVAVVMFLNIRIRMNPGLSVLLALFLMFMSGGILMALLGFLYITTDMHHKMMLGGFTNE